MCPLIPSEKARGVTNNVPAATADTTHGTLPFMVDHSLHSHDSPSAIESAAGLPYPVSFYDCRRRALCATPRSPERQALQRGAVAAASFRPGALGPARAQPS